jgi:hypothetical protein
MIICIFIAQLHKGSRIARARDRHTQRGVGEIARGKRRSGDPLVV